MEHVKKLYLVDERSYNSLKSPWQTAITEKFQESSWSKPAEKRLKTEMHKDMHSLLENDSLPNDEKAKLYNQQHIRFLNTQKGSEMPPVAIKQETISETESVQSKPSKKNKKASKATSPLAWEDWPTPTRSPVIETGPWHKVVHKKKRKVVTTPVRRSSRPKKSIQWDALYNV